MSVLGRRWLSWLLLLLGVYGAWGSGNAHAETPRKRPLPDYSGRGPAPTTPGRGALWVPRVLLFPAYFVSEHLVRRPLGFVVTAAERAEVPKALYDFFAFGPDHKAGVVPTAFIDFGFEPSVGLYAFWDDAGVDGHDLRLRAATWGSDWLSGSVVERVRFARRADLTLSVSALRRPDFAFYGIGPDVLEAALSRYAADSFDARATTHVAFGNGHVLEVASGYRGVSFGAGSHDAEPSLPRAVERGLFAEPPGYAAGYRAGFSKARLVLDTRKSETRSQTGARLELEAEHAAGVLSSPQSGWVRSGATVGGFLDLNDNERVLSLSLTTLSADPLGSQPVPFTELVTLGGTALMPGFRAGRLYDRSALVATLRYAWPIWIWLNGSLQAALGNVFGEHLSGLRFERARLSTALGIESRGSRDSIFQALIGFGSETFENGAQLNSVRLVVGARNGF